LPKKKITNVEVCQVVDQAKITLNLVQNWICKNELIDSKNIEILKTHHIKSLKWASFQIHSNKNYLKNYNILLVIDLEGILKFPFQNLLKTLAIALVDLIVQMESKTQSL